MHRRNFFAALLVLPAVVTKAEHQDGKVLPNYEKKPVTCDKTTFSLMVNGKWHTPLLVPAHE